MVVINMLLGAMIFIHSSCRLNKRCYRKNWILSIGIVGMGLYGFQALFSPLFNQPAPRPVEVLLSASIVMVVVVGDPLERFQSFRELLRFWGGRREQ